MDVSGVFRLDDRVAVVTGAASGIGREIALTFARAGARVACLDIDVAACGRTAGDVEAVGGASLAVECDVSGRRPSRPRSLEWTNASGAWTCSSTTPLSRATPGRKNSNWTSGAEFLT